MAIGDLKLREYISIAISFVCESVQALAVMTEFVGKRKLYGVGIVVVSRVPERIVAKVADT